MYNVAATYRRLVCVYGPKNPSYTSFPFNSLPKSNPQILAFDKAGKNDKSLTIVVKYCTNPPCIG